MAAIDGLSDPVDETFVREFQMSTIAAPVPEPFMEAVIANSRRVPARIWKAVLQGLIDSPITLVHAGGPDAGAGRPAGRSVLGDGADGARAAIPAR